MPLHIVLLETNLFFNEAVCVLLYRGFEVKFILKKY